ncbi:hypothetical protein X975_15751, partial [Stegodyphus mimosarum]
MTSILFERVGNLWNHQVPQRKRPCRLPLSGICTSQSRNLVVIEFKSPGCTNGFIPNGVVPSSNRSASSAAARSKSHLRCLACFL